MPPKRIDPLDPAGCRALARALGDSPQTTIAVHLLCRGLARAYVAGDPTSFRGAVVQSRADPEEPTAFGSDARIIWDLLHAVQGWECINVEPTCAESLAERIEEEWHVPVRFYGDIYYLLPTPVARFASPDVRQLTLDDLDLWEAADPEFGEGGFGSRRRLLEKGFAAGAIVDGRLVALAHTSARTGRYADIGVHTLDGWRNRGYATAAASIVARLVQEDGEIPVWSTGEDNAASIRVAEKLGFLRESERVYVIPQRG